MSNHLHNGAIHVKDLLVWAHVGVLEEERYNGQWFCIDFTLRLDLDVAARDDDLEATADYSLAIKAIQKLALSLDCHTIEYFSDQICLRLEELYGLIPMRVCLSKCSPPVPGFEGTVSVERTRNGFTF